MLGSWIVKVEPRPSSLATVMSPPIIWQKRLLIASAAVLAGSGGKAAVARGAPQTADAEFPPPRAVYLGCPTGPNKRTSGDCGGSPSCRVQLGIQP
jgi:hypothetical protein